MHKIDEKKLAEGRSCKLSPTIQFPPDPTIAKRLSALREQLKAEGKWIGQRERIR